MVCWHGRTRGWSVQRWLTSGQVQAVFRKCGLHADVMKTQLYEVALAHPSSVSSRGIVEGENQRQEFLGDAVLNLAAALYAFQRYPTAQEGTLTQVRSALVQRQTLSGFSRRLGLDALLPSACPRDNDRVLADAFESFVAARFLDVMGSTGGDVGEAFKEARAFVLAVFTTFDDFVVETPAVNYKGRLNDICLQAGRVAPEYRRVYEDVTNPNNTFYEVEVHATPFAIVATGSGGTVKAAQQAAARSALLDINGSHPAFSTPGIPLQE